MKIADNRALPAFVHGAFRDALASLDQEELASVASSSDENGVPVEYLIATPAGMATASIEWVPWARGSGAANIALNLVPWRDVTVTMAVSVRTDEAAQPTVNVRMGAADVMRIDAPAKGDRRRAFDDLRRVLMERMAGA